MNNRKINIGIIGCGRIAGHHCQSIKDVKGVEHICADEVLCFL